MNRRNFLASASVVAALQPQPVAAAVPGGTNFVERARDFDSAAFAKRVERHVGIRQLFEAVGFHPQFLSNVKNSLNGLQFGFGYPPETIALVACPHGPSSAYIYNNSMWVKYRIGEALSLQDAGGEWVTTNIYVEARPGISPGDSPDKETGYYHDTSVETLQHRGVIFLACHTAIEEQARKLVQQGFAPDASSPSDVAADILGSLIPGVLVVPSMVSAIAVLQQRFNYAYTTIAF